MKKQKTLRLLVITKNTCNKQTIKEKHYRKNKKGIDHEVNKIVSCRKKWKKIFMRYTKLTCAEDQCSLPLVRVHSLFFCDSILFLDSKPAMGLKSWTTIC